MARCRSTPAPSAAASSPSARASAGALISADIVGSFTKDGDGLLSISGTNYSDGNVSVTVAAGTLLVVRPQSLADGTDLNVGDTSARARRRRPRRRSRWGCCPE